MVAWIQVRIVQDRILQSFNSARRFAVWVVAWRWSVLTPTVRSRMVEVKLAQARSCVVVGHVVAGVREVNGGSRIFWQVERISLEEVVLARGQGGGHQRVVVSVVGVQRIRWLVEARILKILSWKRNVFKIVNNVLYIISVKREYGN